MTKMSIEGWERVVRGGDRVVIRPLHAQDAGMERRFIEGLSPVARRFRFLDSMKSPGAALLEQLTVLDPKTDVAYVAVTEAGGQEKQVGVGRFSASSGGHDCEFAVTVTDAWQNKGLGTLLMQHLIDDARKRGIDAMHSSDAWDNDLMRRFAAHLGLQHRQDPEDATRVLYSLELKHAETVNTVTPAKFFDHGSK
jgi:GNAT superfamily N-acetyltransferase